MPLTKLDTNTTLIVIDLQKLVVGLPTAHPMADVIQKAALLTDAFRRHSLPVVLVNVSGVAPGRAEQSWAMRDLPAGWDELIPELGQQPGDHTVTKHTWGAFTNTDLLEYLESNSVTQLVIIGVATSAGVESTARFAHELGFNVTLATDAMTDMSAEAHENSLTRIFPKMSETGTTEEVLALLDGVRE